MSDINNFYYFVSYVFGDDHARYCVLDYGQLMADFPKYDQRLALGQQSIVGMEHVRLYKVSNFDGVRSVTEIPNFPHDTDLKRLTKELHSKYDKFSILFGESIIQKGDFTK